MFDSKFIITLNVVLRNITNYNIVVFDQNIYNYINNCLEFISDEGMAFSY